MTSPTSISAAAPAARLFGADRRLVPARRDAPLDPAAARSAIAWRCYAGTGAAA